jgi:hypothetical protein
LLRYGKPRRPQGKGAVEAQNAFVKTALRQIFERCSSFEEARQEKAILLEYVNTMPRRSLGGRSPYWIMYRLPPPARRGTWTGCQFPVSDMPDTEEEHPDPCKDTQTLIALKEQRALSMQAQRTRFQDGRLQGLRAGDFVDVLCPEDCATPAEEISLPR